MDTLMSIGAFAGLAVVGTAAVHLSKKRRMQKLATDYVRRTWTVEHLIHKELYGRFGPRFATQVGKGLEFHALCAMLFKEGDSEFTPKAPEILRPFITGLLDVIIRPESMPHINAVVVQYLVGESGSDVPPSRRSNSSFSEEAEEENTVFDEEDEDEIESLPEWLFVRRAGLCQGRLLAVTELLMSHVRARCDESHAGQLWTKVQLIVTPQYDWLRKVIPAAKEGQPFEDKLQIRIQFDAESLVREIYEVGRPVLGG